MFGYSISTSCFKLFIGKYKVFELNTARHRELWNRFVTQLKTKRLAKIQERIAQKLKNGEKIKVCFLTHTNEKWKFQSLYDLLETDPRFEPMILVGGQYKVKRVHEVLPYQTAEIFREHGMRADFVMDNKTWQVKSLNIFKPDIVIYQFPWNIPMIQNPLYVGRFAITCTASYGFNVSADYDHSYMEYHHRLVNAVFTETEGTKEDIINHVNNIDPSQLIVTGCAKLDGYIGLKRQPRSRPLIIYAPHWSVRRPFSPMATFQENAYEILEMAESYGDKFEWAYRPHPALMETVIKTNVMSEVDYRRYVRRWEAIGHVLSGYDYLQEFLDSSALITDSCAFLAEYLPTGNPVFHLINHKVNWADFAKPFLDTYYDIDNPYDISKLFKQVIVDGDDYKKIRRLESIKTIFDPQKQNAASKMLDVIKSLSNIK